MVMSMVIAYSLGLLHTLEAGHSKTILTGVLVNGNTTRYKAFGYVLLFTFTHIADILILGTILTVLQASLDVYSFLPRLELLSGIILFCIGLIMFYKTIKHTTHHIHPHSHNHAHAHNIPTQIFNWKYIAGTALASGLAPCLMGWSLFFIVLSTKSAWAIFPVILAFGLGIATVLITMILLSQLFIRHLPKKFGIIILYAPLISSLIILFSAIMMIIRSL
jgi:ABC-type nickel/cobalt efflux system permease component RcnA